MLRRPSLRLPPCGDTLQPLGDEAGQRRQPVGCRAADVVDGADGLTGEPSGFGAGGLVKLLAPQVCLCCGSAHNRRRQAAEGNTCVVDPPAVKGEYDRYVDHRNRLRTP
ncbi:MAG: hypothetical protein KatS3mg057_0212 [Herpetosiphonaceae bacterium]|nr:MAG: hypothetical protein KatS3mg057_0212 [Herpetosiphonaceae bacterium]